MFNLFASTIDTVTCSLFSVEAADASFIPQLPESFNNASYNYIFSSLILFIFTVSITGMIAFKLKRSDNNKDIVQDTKHSDSDGHNLAQKGKPPEPNFASARIVSFKTLLSKPKALGWHARLNIPLANLTDHQKARRSAYGVESHDPHSLKDIAMEHKLSQLFSTNLNCGPLVLEQCSLIELTRKVGKSN